MPIILFPGRVSCIGTQLHHRHVVYVIANQLNLPCAAVSVVTDECDPENLHPVDISTIIAVANTADGKLSKLFAAVVEAL